MTKVALSRRVHGILFDFDNTLVPTVEANIHAFHKARSKLLEFFAAENAEKIASDFQALVTSISPWPPESFQLGHHQWRVKLWEKALSCKSDVSCNSEKPSAAAMYEIWRTARLEKMVITDEIESLIRELAKDYKLAIVTNSDSVIQREKLAACGAEKFFKTIVISSEQPYAKPHPSIFHTACSMIDVQPNGCVMVGDSLLHDIEGGNSAGLMATVWIKLEGSNWNEGNSKPDFIIDSVLSLPDVLEKLNL